MKNLAFIKLAFLAVVFCNVAVDISHKILLQNIAFKIFDGSEQTFWISIINSLIILPFLLLFSFSGYLSDKYNKKNILILGAVSSFSLSVLMVIAYSFSSFYLAMFTLFLLAIQSAIYSPAKFGIIIDIYGKDKLPKGNSSMQAISIIAILFTMALFSFLFESFFTSNNLELIKTKEELLHSFLPLTLYVLPIALFEMIVSLLVLKKIDTNFKSRDNFTFDKESYLKGKMFLKNIKSITNNKVIFLSVIGLSIFWGISQGFLAVFPAFAKEYLLETNVFVINGVIASSGIGIAIGSVIYSKLSKNYIELGTIPIAAIGMSVMIFLSTVVENISLMTLAFLFFGIFGGLFVVPLNSLIQFNSRKNRLGTILAGNNWFQSLFMFIILAGTTIVSFYNLNSLNTLYILLVITIAGTFYTIYKLPQSMILLFLKFVVGLRYKLIVNGIKNIPSNGGVLLLGNHVSWIDWAVMYLATPRDIKFVMDKTIYNKWYLNWILSSFEAIPISNIGSKETIKIVAKELDKGSVVVLFPEGSITRNGHLGEFKKGFELILRQTKKDIPVVAFYIRGLWESMFSRANKKFKKSYKNKSVSISFSKIIPKEKANTLSVRKEVTNLATSSWEDYIKSLDSVSKVIFDSLKDMKNKLIFADSTGVELSGHKFLTASILFKKLLTKEINAQNVGLILPSTSAGAFVNYSILMMGKTAVNLNYTSEIESIKKAIKKADIKELITSKKFVEKLKGKSIEIDKCFEGMKVIFLEDLKPKISKFEGLKTLLSIKLLPSFLLKTIHIKNVSKDSTSLILFSSGSEGEPKGVELSSDNILGNAKQIASVLNVKDKDVMLGSLPLFHAFGIVVTTFLPLIEGIACVAHPDPTDGQGIGKIVAKYKATIMTGTSTFFRLYTINPKVHPLMFESLRYVVAGAEKLRENVRVDFKRKFGKDILEGYGTTETTPVAACNLPNVLTPEFTVQEGSKVGSVGMPIPGTLVKIVDPESFEELENEKEGMVLISGIQVMKGYLKDEHKTNEVLKVIDKRTYYITGDKGKIDKNGFLSIVDRYSRFAKLGGEMVSLGAIEEKLLKIVDNEEIDFLATSLPDNKKGEKVILLISGVSNEKLEKIKIEINNRFDNKLMIPSSYKIVAEIPKLGSGKKDFKKAKELA